MGNGNVSVLCIYVLLPYVILVLQLRSDSGIVENTVPKHGQRACVCTNGSPRESNKSAGRKNEERKYIAAS